MTKYVWLMGEDVGHLIYDLMGTPDKAYLFLDLGQPDTGYAVCIKGQHTLIIRIADGCQPMITVNREPVEEEDGGDTHLSFYLDRDRRYKLIATVREWT